MMRAPFRTAALLLAWAALASPASAQPEASPPPTDSPEAEPPMPPAQPTDATPLDRSHPPEPGANRPYALPDVSRRVLDNGLIVVLIDRPDFPTVSARLSIRAGRDVAGTDVALAELTARTLRDGTTTRTAEQVADFVDRNGIDFAIDVNTNQVLLRADALSSALPEVLSLLGDLAANPVFPDARVASRIDERVAELEVASAEPGFHRDRLMRRVAFGTHAYGSLYPTAEAVRAITPQALRAFHAANYGPARATLVIVGALPDDLEASLGQTLGAWSREVAAYQPPAPVALTTCNEAHVVLRDDSAQTSILWVGPGPMIGSEGWFSALVANHVLGGGASARLFLNLRQDKSYTYGAYSRLVDMLGTAWFQASADVRSEVTEPALTEFENEFTRYQSEPLPEAELQDAEQYLSGVFPLELETNAALASRLSSLIDLGLGVEFLQSYRENVQGVALGSAESRGRTFIARPQLALVLVGEEEVVVPAAQAHASRVFVYDLDGTQLREEPGTQPTSCR